MPNEDLRLSTGVAVKVTGSWQKSLGGTKQTHELLADTVVVSGNHNAEVRENVISVGAIPMLKIKCRLFLYRRSIIHWSTYARYRIYGYAGRIAP